MNILLSKNLYFLSIESILKGTVHQNWKCCYHLPTQWFSFIGGMQNKIIWRIFMQFFLYNQSNKKQHKNSYSNSYSKNSYTLVLYDKVEIIICWKSWVVALKSHSFSSRGVKMHQYYLQYIHSTTYFPWLFYLINNKMSKWHFLSQAELVNIESKQLFINIQLYNANCLTNYIYFISIFLEITQ